MMGWDVPAFLQGIFEVGAVAWHGELHVTSGLVQEVS
jgi:hypothetical protein